MAWYEKQNKGHIFIYILYVVSEDLSFSKLRYQIAINIVHLIVTSWSNRYGKTEDMWTATYFNVIPWAPKWILGIITSFWLVFLREPHCMIWRRARSLELSHQLLSPFAPHWLLMGQKTVDYGNGILGSLISWNWKLWSSIYIVTCKLVTLICCSMWKRTYCQNIY